MSAGQTAQPAIGRLEAVSHFQYPQGRVDMQRVSNVTDRKPRLLGETLVHAQSATCSIARGEIPTGQKRTQLTSAIQNILRVEN